MTLGQNWECLMRGEKPSGKNIELCFDIDKLSFEERNEDDLLLKNVNSAHQVCRRKAEIGLCQVRKSLPVIRNVPCDGIDLLPK